MLKLLYIVVSSGSNEMMFSKAFGGEEKETNKDMQQETVTIISFFSVGLHLSNEKLVF